MSAVLKALTFPLLLMKAVIMPVLAGFEGTAPVLGTILGPYIEGLNLMLKCKDNAI